MTEVKLTDAVRRQEREDRNPKTPAEFRKEFVSYYGTIATNLVAGGFATTSAVRGRNVTFKKGTAKPLSSAGRAFQVLVTLIAVANVAASTAVLVERHKAKAELEAQTD